MQVVGAAAPIVSGGLSVFSGAKERQSLREQAFASEYEARSFDLRARQASADRRSELRDAMAAIQVARAGSNVSLDSPTALAVERGLRAASSRAEVREVLGEKQAAFGKRLEAKQLRKAGNSALISGIARGIGSASGSSLFRPKG